MHAEEERGGQVNGVHTYVGLHTDDDRPDGPLRRTARPLKEEFQRPTQPPSLVLPLVPLPPETGVLPQASTMRVFVQFVPVISNTVFSDAEIAEVTSPLQNRTVLT